MIQVSRVKAKRVRARAKRSPAPTLFKVLVGGSSGHGGTLKWSLPEGDKPGEWHDVSGDLTVCERGIHLTDEPARWYKPGCKVYVVEAEGVIGECKDHDDRKVVARRVRLLREASETELVAVCFFTGGAHQVRDRVAVALGSSSVEALGSSHVVARESSRVVAWGSSSVEAWDSSSVEARESSHVEARESSSVEAWDSSSVVARESSSVVARGSSRVVARGSSRVEAWGSSSVVAWGSSSVVAGDKVVVVVVDRRATPTIDLKGCAVYVDQRATVPIATLGPAAQSAPGVAS